MVSFQIFNAIVRLFVEIFILGNQGPGNQGFTILFQELKSCNLGLCLRQFQFVPVDQLKATRKCLSLHNMFDTLT
jgi:hypothetical protein